MNGAQEVYGIFKESMSSEGDIRETIHGGFETIDEAVKVLTLNTCPIDCHKRDEAKDMTKVMLKTGATYVIKDYHTKEKMGFVSKWIDGPPSQAAKAKSM